MTPWQRALRAAVLALALGAGAVAAPYGAAPSHAAVLAPDDEDAFASPTVPPVPSGSAEPSRAGSRAGQGRERPGRPEAASEAPGVTDATVPPEVPREPVPEPPEPADEDEPVRQAATAESPATPVLRILPLGSGLVLIGLGLGLAFVGLRLRRG
ncbi:hypothetical protein [Streptomyces sp. NPDC057382]|uniref:hypothetical protein n=1 Tax=unclassified Streptomyces TaxID=2593676 RepID=UPI0036328D71